MVKITILGSCRYEPYEILAVPHKLDPELYEKEHEKASQIAFNTVFKKAIDESDIVIVYAPYDEELGKHTKKDVDYATSIGKPICFAKGFVIPKNAVWKEKVISGENPKDKCQYCGSTNGYWSSIYDWHCRDCGKVTID